ncbi:sulfatase-like hydrolase/transferase [Echinicola shivajiensis]|uniref:sulfatase-like hydrolase/transferase n=1 Tax=Echinicola shivajiensis TaxID=1035916 RepID=UPI001BFC0A46|nr:sulfatase-like hydrolase/transferase [Echinicola shivajiensis]
MIKYFIFAGVFMLNFWDLVAQVREKAESSKPNIIFILGDDMGYETLGYKEVLNFQTPNLDALAQESTDFTNCDAQPLCVPTRVKLITGQYNYRNYTGWGSFNLEFLPLGQMMKAAGYTTAAFGKWHLSKTPEELGFDEFSLFNGSPGELTYAEFFKRYFYNCPLEENEGAFIADYAPDRFNERTLDFIEKNQDQPFFIYYPMSLAHNPFEPTPDSVDPTSTDWQQNFEDMVTYADKMIGNVIQKLKENGLYENTIIIYTTDNGSKTLEHHMSDGEVIYGGKGTTSHDGVHVPLLVKYDGKRQTSDELVDFTDFYPTFADLAGYDLSAVKEKLDGVSLLPVLDQKQRVGKPYIFSTFFHPLTTYIRDKDYKLYYDGRLYNLKEDPRELHPFYQQNDSGITASARTVLEGLFDDIFENSELSKYPAKHKLLGKYGDYKGLKDEVMLGGYIYDKLEFTPQAKVIKVDLSKFISNTEQTYQLRIAREYESSNSGLTYANVKVKHVKIIKSGKVLRELGSLSLELKTERDYVKLRESGNPIISFKMTGDNSMLELGKLENSKAGKVELELEVEVSNPDNQWGDRIMLYVFLDRMNSV